MIKIGFKDGPKADIHMFAALCSILDPIFLNHECFCVEHYILIGNLLD